MNQFVICLREVAGAAASFVVAVSIVLIVSWLLTDSDQVD